MKTKNLTLSQIFALFKVLRKDEEKTICLYINDMNIYKQLYILEYDYIDKKYNIIFSSKLYKYKYFDKQLTKFVKEEELPY